MAERTRYAAGIVHYGSDPGLGACLAALLAQSEPPRHVVVVDHDPIDEVGAARAALQARHPEVEWIQAPNGGYSAGANRVIAHCLRAAPALEHVLVLNPDVVLESCFAAEILAALEARPEVALASGKLLRPGGRLIDSAGIELRRGRRFRDRGCEEPDDGRYGAVEPVFAVSGAALFVRRAALASLAVAGEIFDEDFFTYHEDTDLAWRAQRLGWQSLYVPSARAIHVRGWRPRGRQRVAVAIRRHSFKNRYLELIKNESFTGFVRDLPFILAVEIARLGFAVAADRALLGAYLEAARLARRALRKRAMIRRAPGQGPARAAQAAGGVAAVPALSGIAAGAGRMEGN